MLDWMNGTITELISVARNATILVAVMSILIVWYQTKALIPVLTAVLVAAIALWAVSASGISTIEGWIAQDAAGVMVVLELGATAPGR